MGNMEKREQGHAGDISECLGENNHLFLTAEDKNLDISATFVVGF